METTAKIATLKKEIIAQFRWDIAVMG